MEKIFTDANIVRGLIIVSSPQSSSKIISDLVTQFDASLYTYTEESEVLDEAKARSERAFGRWIASG